MLNSDTSSTCPANMVNFGLLTAEICWRAWGTPANFNGFRVLIGSVRHTARHFSSGRQPHFAALNRGRHLFGRATITLGIGPHSSCFSFIETVCSAFDSLVSNCTTSAVYRYVVLRQSVHLGYIYRPSSQIFLYLAGSDRPQIKS